jgi:hypothetical protein
MSESPSRLETAEVRVEEAQAVLDTVKRALEVAETAQATAARAGTMLRTTNIVVLASAAVLGVLIFVARRHH